jgi:hypothetical protein
MEYNFVNSGIQAKAGFYFRSINFTDALNLEIGLAAHNFLQSGAASEQGDNFQHFIPISAVSSCNFEDFAVSKDIHAVRLSILCPSFLQAQPLPLLLP